MKIKNLGTGYAWLLDGHRQAWRLLVGLAVLMPIGSATGAEVDSRVDVTLTGGPHAGTYSVVFSYGCEIEVFDE